MEVSFMDKPTELVKAYIKVGEVKKQMSVGRMVLLGISAGMFIACGASASSVAMHNIGNVGVARLVGGVVFPVGLMMILLVGGELFTGDCLMIMGVLKGRYAWMDMVRVLSLVWLSNLVGGCLMAFLIAGSGQFRFTDGLLGAYTIKCALGKTSLSFGTALVSGILCNIFVCLAVLMAAAAKDVSGKVWASFFPIMAFVVSGYEHCVANMYYIPAGILAAGNAKYASRAMEMYGITPGQLESLNWVSFLVKNELPVTLGNILGGALFVGVLLYLIHKDDGKEA